MVCKFAKTSRVFSCAIIIIQLGIPYIREMSKITGVSGSDLMIKCPVAGYPIDKIQWERGEL